MSANQGKKFEQVIKDAFLKVPNVSVDRIPDQVSGFKVTSANVCDFIVYKKPHEYYIECKTIHGNTLPFSNIRPNQWEGLLEKSKIEGVVAGVICWWTDKDVTRFIPIQLLQWMKNDDKKSIRYDCDWLVGIPDEKPFTFKEFHECIDIKGKKKRVFFDYDMSSFFQTIEENKKNEV